MNDSSKYMTYKKYSSINLKSTAYKRTCKLLAYSLTLELAASISRRKELSYEVLIKFGNEFMRTYSSSKGFTMDGGSDNAPLNYVFNTMLGKPSMNHDTLAKGVMDISSSTIYAYEYDSIDMGLLINVDSEPECSSVHRLRKDHNLSGRARMNIIAFYQSLLKDTFERLLYPRMLSSVVDMILKDTSKTSIFSIHAYYDAFKTIACFGCFIIMLMMDGCVRDRGALSFHYNDELSNMVRLFSDRRVRTLVIDAYNPSIGEAVLKSRGFNPIASNHYYDGVCHIYESESDIVQIAICDDILEIESRALERISTSTRLIINAYVCETEAVMEITSLISKYNSKGLTPIYGIPKNINYVGNFDIMIFDSNTPIVVKTRTKSIDLMNN